MKALLIRFDPETGRRPQGVDPKDPKLQCYGWQNLGVRPAIEIRVIEDDRDIGQYKNREGEGLIVLSNNAKIDAAIDQYILTRVIVENETLMRIDLEQRGIKLENVPGTTTTDVLRSLKGQQVRGIKEIKPLKMADVYPQRSEG